MDTKELIMDATIQAFNRKGIKFTMDDIAKELHISKKTIYALFKTKENLFLSTVDYCFNQIHESEQYILEDSSLTTLEKLQKMLVVLPERYQNIDWRNIYLCKGKYPLIYVQIERRLRNGWENTFNLLNQAIEEKVIRPISIPVLKEIVDASLEHFISSTVLIKYDVPYDTALDEFISIIMHGIVAK